MSFNKFPSFSQWKQLFKILKRSEKIIFLIFIALFLGSFIFLLSGLYINNTKIIPAFGGSYTEGIVGQPRFINPIYGETNDTDRTLIDLVYSGLMTYNENGEIVKDLAKDYKISEDGKTYEFTLKDNIFWQDGRPLIADDVIFTIKTIQNSDYKSPLRANWLDISIEKTSNKSFSFFLKNPYNSFLENATVKIIPRHIWENILPESFALSSYNLQPIGSGPYVLSKLDQTNTGFIKSIGLKAYRKYHGKLPYITNVSFKFFDSKETLIDAANQKTIDGFSTQAQEEIRQGWSENERFKIYSLSLPRYFAVFFNIQKGTNSSQAKTNIFSNENVRKALNYSIDKENLVKKVNSLSSHKVSAVESPILPDFFGYKTPSAFYEFDTDKAKALLDKAGFKDNGSGQMAKPNDKKPAFQFKKYLSVGSKGKDVIELQGCLSRLPDDKFKGLLLGETSGAYGKNTGKAVFEFQKKYLPDAEPTGEAGKLTRQKLNELCIPSQSEPQLLKFSLTTINQPQLTEIANTLKNYWQNIGISVEIKTAEISELKAIIKERNYDALLYGQALGSLPDLYPFWHSSQINDPGLNLTGYQDKNTDSLLKDARETISNEIKKEKYEKLQNIIIDKAPALFLYNNDFIYWVSEKVKGINATKIVDPAKRFSNIENWFIRTKRTWK
ncbi:MAG: peptide/nickel transport system substrate-binding protein [Parcubacteria group bacterium Licking1014_1]|nr:MAG: peptide/nickel transport system substrate-binding protein [Parcubacteria group bacterium Licking1014_1]